MRGLAWPGSDASRQLFSSNEIPGLSVMNTILLVSAAVDCTQNISSYHFFSTAKELRQSTINPVNEALKSTECVH